MAAGLTAASPLLLICLASMTDLRGLGFFYVALAGVLFLPFSGALYLASRRLVAQAKQPLPESGTGTGTGTGSATWLVVVGSVGWALYICCLLIPSLMTFAPR